MTLAFLVLLGAPYIYEISSLRVKCKALLCRSLKIAFRALLYRWTKFQIAYPILRQTEEFISEPRIIRDVTQYLHKLFPSRVKSWTQILPH